MRTVQYLFFALFLSLAGIAEAQVSVNINVGAPAWAPRDHRNAQYYFIPEVNAYYDARARVFIYQEGPRWVRRSQLPGRYRGYDLRRTRVVVLHDYRGSTPYSHYNDHRRMYDPRYRAPQPSRTTHYESNKHDNGNHGRGNSGHGSGHGKK